jgi:hypothetical protein
MSWERKAMGMRKTRGFRRKEKRDTRRGRLGMEKSHWVE